MFVLGNVLLGLAAVLGWALTLYSWILIARAIVSWVSADPRNPIVYFLHRATDPAIEFIRRLLPMKLKYFPLDIAFLVLFGLVIFAQYAIVQSLADIALRLRPRPTALSSYVDTPRPLSDRVGRATLRPEDPS